MSATQVAIPHGYLVDPKSSFKIALSQEVLIGRETGILDSGVSKRHCVVKYSGNQFFVADINSRNGTFLNNKRLEPNRWNPLSAGDRLCVGGVDFEVALPRERRPAAIQARQNDESESPEFNEASYMRRFFALWLDQLFGVLLMTAVSMALPVGAATLLGLVLYYALVILIPMLYCGQTLGKMALGLRVLMADGEELALKQVLQRELMMKAGVLLLFTGVAGFTASINPLAAILVILAFPLGAILKAYFDGQIYWDEFCGTRVIRERE